MRIAFYASYPNQPIGYSKVAYQLSNYLAAKEEVTALLYVGTGNIAQTRLASRQSHPAIQFVDVREEEERRGIQDGYGPALIEEILTQFNPDVFLIYNDIIVTCRIFNALLKYRAENTHVRFVSYLDIIYPFQKPDYVQHVNQNTDQIFVFSECWVQNLIAMGVPAAKVAAFPHGFSEDLFFPLPKQLARSFVGLQEGDFVILNTNRNTYRKCQDIMIAGFLEFYCRRSEKERNTLKLFLNCALNTSSGYDITDVVHVECLKHGLSSADILQTVILRSSEPGVLTDEMLNYAMNAADVGVNTCCGEGFGLCNLEHGGIGRPQIVSAVGALKDTFGNTGDSLSLPVRYSMRAPNCMDVHSGELQYVSATDFVDALEFYYSNPVRMEEHGQRLRERIQTQFAWETLLDAFWNNLNKPL